MSPAFAWSWPRIVGYTFVLAIVYIVAQTGAVIAAAAVQAILVPGFHVEAWLERADRDGVAVMAGLFASTVLCVPVVWMLVRRHEAAPWTFLGLRPVSMRAVLVACVATAVFIVVSDSVNVWLLDRPLVPPFMSDIYATARKPAFLIAMMVVCAPFTEELLFRGFLYGALQAKRLGMGWCVAVTSLAFTAVHTQYDFHDMAMVLMMAVLLGAARARYQSVVPGMTMHALLNAIAFVETALVSR